MIKRLVKKKIGGQKNKASKVLAIPPNSLDFKQLPKSSLVDNNLLRFRKVRQTKGTPRGLWTSSPTNQSMSELMAFSFKKEPKEKKKLTSIPTYLTVENMCQIILAKIDEMIYVEKVSERLSFKL